MPLAKEKKKPVQARKESPKKKKATPKQVSVLDEKYSVPKVQKLEVYEKQRQEEKQELRLVQANVQTHVPPNELQSQI